MRFIKKAWAAIVRLWRLNLGCYYDPYFKSSDGVLYAKMPNGQIVRLESKKKAKRLRRTKELRNFFKKK